MHSARSIAVIVAVISVAAALASPDRALTLCVGAALAVAIWFLWPATDAPVLLLPFGLQWLSVAMKPIESALTGQPLDNFGDLGQPLTAAAWFGLAGVSALGMGMWLASRRTRVDWASTLARDASQWNSGLILPISLSLVVVGTLLEYISQHTGTAIQIFLAFGAAKDVGLFVLAYWCLRQGKALWVLAAVTAAEVVIGLTGYFAGFREPFLVLLIAAAAARPRLGPRGLFAVGGVFAALLTVTVFWSAIKPDYRQYLSQGARAQVVDRTLSQRLSYVGQAADRFNETQFQTGLRNLTARISYIDYLASTLKYVPEVRPHEHGALLTAALTNMVEPRILFPDKPPTPNDTDVVNRYTGLNIRSNAYQGSSISIGYLGELYIDFGFVGGVIGGFAIGVLAGLFYRVLRQYRGIPLFFSYGLAVMVLVDFATFDTDLVRLLGSAVTDFLAALVLQRWVAPQALQTLVRREARTQPA